MLFMTIILLIMTMTLLMSLVDSKMKFYTYNDLSSNNSNSNVLKEAGHNRAIWNIPMPVDSLFKGMPIPSNETKWNKARIQAARGNLVLLKKVRSKISNPHDLIQLDKPSRWAHKMADFLLNKNVKWNPDLFIKKYNEVDRSLIVLAGHHKFKDDNFEGDEVIADIKEYSPRDMIDDMKVMQKNSKDPIPVPIVLLGFPEENTCWLGTYFLNRTLANVFNDGTMGGPLRKEKNEIYKLLDHPNILAVITHQHHNLSHHPKVLSLPCGVDDAKSLWDTLNFVNNKVSNPYLRKEALLEFRKKHFLFTASSNWGPRPMIIECVKSRVMDSFFVLKEKIDSNKYYINLIQSYAVLAVPGLGYDTMRLWESLALGAMPVLEKSIGLDKTLYKLPALLVDDFASVTPDLIRRAYVEAIYHADMWEYERLSRKWYTDLIYQISIERNIKALLKKHPIEAHDNTFTRPLIPYDCSKGCGPGTKRTPVESCAINQNFEIKGYNWVWQEHWWPNIPPSEQLKVLNNLYEERLK